MSNGLISFPKADYLCWLYENTTYIEFRTYLVRIKHSVMYDEDDMMHCPQFSSSANLHTNQIEALSPDLLPRRCPKKPHQKPQHLMYQYHQRGIASSVLNNSAVAN